MDLKYILCEPISKLAVKANEQVTLIQQHQDQRQATFGLEWSNQNVNHSNQVFSTLITKQTDWTNHSTKQNGVLSSPKSVCSSLSTCSSTSTNSSDDEYVTLPGRSSSFSSLRPQIEQPSRRRTASDASLSRHHMFIYSHPNRRPRSESAGNTNVQTRTPWTPFEDQLLQQGYDQGLSWAMISSTYLPHRSRGCCWGRFKTLQNKNMVDPNHSQLRHFRRPWKAIDFNNTNSKKLTL